MADKKTKNNLADIEYVRNTMLPAEIDAHIAYVLAVQSKNSLCRDNFLLSFLPRITDELLEEMGHHCGYEGISGLIRDNTLLLPEIVEAAYKKMQIEWEREKIMVCGIRNRAKNLIYIISEAAKLTDGVSYLTEKQTFEIGNKLVRLIKARDKAADVLSKLSKETENKDLLLEDRIRKTRELAKASERVEDLDAHAAMTKAKLTANDEFSVLASDRELLDVFTHGMDASGKKKIMDMPAEERISALDMTFYSYCSCLYEKESGEFNDIKNYYITKYSCVPDFVQAYGAILELFHKEIDSMEPDNSDMYRIYRKGIRQYTDILKDAPDIILQISRLYPELQSSYDFEVDLNRSEDIFSSISNVRNSRIAKYYLTDNFWDICGNAATQATSAPIDKNVVSLVGPAGTGKTARVEAMARKLGLFFKEISIPAADPSIFAGLPTVTSKDQVRQLASADMEEAIRRPGIIDFEEITATQNQELHSQLTRLTQSGELTTGVYIHPLSILISTSNDDLRDNPSLTLLPRVVLNRIEQVEYKNPTHLINGWINYIYSDPAIVGDKYLSKAFDMIISFLRLSDTGRKFDGLSYESRVLLQENENQPVPSFRSWTKFARECASVIAAKELIEIKTEKLKKKGCGIIGGAAAGAFAKHYMDVSIIPSIDELIKTMESGGRQWTNLDALRIFDLDNGIKDTAGKTLSSLLTDNKHKMPTNTRDSASVGARDKKYGRYAVSISEENDKTMFLHVNEVYRNLTGKECNFDSSVLMSEEEMNKRYNELWDRDGLDLNQQIVAFTLIGEITARAKRLYENAGRAQRPVDGEMFDKLLRLAMTLPSPELRITVVIRMIKEAFSASNLLTVYSHGVKNALTARGTGRTKEVKYIIKKLLPPDGFMIYLTADEQKNIHSGGAGDADKPFIKVNNKNRKKEIEQEAAETGLSIIPVESLYQLTDAQTWLWCASSTFKRVNDNSAAFKFGFGQDSAQ